MHTAKSAVRARSSRLSRKGKSRIAPPTTRAVRPKFSIAVAGGSGEAEEAAQRGDRPRRRTRPTILEDELPAAADGAAIRRLLQRSAQLHRDLLARLARR